MYTLLEDCSPYYIRFTHSNIQQFIDRTLLTYCQHAWDDNKNLFKHRRLAPNQGKEILDQTPLSKTLSLDFARVSYFVSEPGLQYRAHKDGLDHRFSINYTVKILDDKCITSWYSDQDLDRYTIDTMNNRSRECVGFDPSKHTPLQSMTARFGECILFNTDIFHAWDNSQSQNQRIVLTLRSTTPSAVYFDDAKKILFPGIGSIGSAGILPKS